MMRLVKCAGLFAAIAFSCGCSATEQSEKSSKVEVLQLKNGLTYAIARNQDFKTTDLPPNDDLKMVDGDLARFAALKCSLQVAVQYAPSQCDIYVQADNAGTLIGFAFVYKDQKGVSFSTATALNDQKQAGGGECDLEGPVYDEGSQFQKQMSEDPSRNFSGRSQYAFMDFGGVPLTKPIAPNASAEYDSDPDYKVGVWYLTKQGDKLRVAQERWNYCYDDKNVVVDDVYYRALSLIKQ